MAIEETKDSINELNSELQLLLEAVTSIGANLDNSFSESVDRAVELGKVSETLGETLKKGYQKDLKSVAKITEDLIKANARQQKGTLKLSEIQKLKNRLIDIQATKNARIGIAIANQVDLNDSLIRGVVDLNDNLEGVEGAVENITNEQLKFGAAVNLVREQFIKLPATIQDGALLVLKYMVERLKEVDSEVANLQRSFAVTKSEGLAINEQLARTALSARTLGVNLETVTQATNDLNSALGGTANLFTTDIRNGVAFAEERLGLSAEAASNLAIEAINTGKAFNTVVAENEAAFKAVKATTGVSLNFRQTLEEANKISGALRLNLEATPGGLIEAVAAAKSLGLEMAQIEGIQSSILDFEQSIASELQAEALTGKELNLERARTAALNNDIAGLTQEIATQFGSVAEFQQMNVIQQEAFANAVGLNKNQLSDILRTQESINNTLQTGVETQGDSLTANAAALSAQEALTQSISSLNTILKASLALILGIAAAAAIFLTGGLAAIPLAAGGQAAIGGLLAGGLAFGAQQAVSDGIAPSSKGPFTVTDNFGATAVTAAGDNVVVSPNVSSGNSGGITQAQATEMISLLREVANKDFSINMDGRKLSSAMETSGVSYNI